MALSADQQEELAKIFDDYDEDNSGGIDIDELKMIAEDLGEPLSREELEALVDEMDSDNSGQISLVEYMKWWAKD